jgi:hypothetical protein
MDVRTANKLGCGIMSGLGVGTTALIWAEATWPGALIVTVAMGASLVFVWWGTLRRRPARRVSPLISVEIRRDFPGER